MGVTTDPPVRILVVHRGLHLREVEQYEIYEIVSGLAQAAAGSGDVVHATDCWSLYDAVLGPDGELVYERTGSALTALLTRYDVAHVHMVLPQLHLLAAVLLRLRGVRIVLSPMAMLGDDFAQASWFRTRSTAFLWLKRPVVAGMRLAWRQITTAYVVQSSEEARLAQVDLARTSLIPLPAPRTPLGNAALDGMAPAGDPTGPVAFVSRLDPWRKGLDRLCDWLDAFAKELPRPAAVLFAADDGGPRPAALPDLIERGLLRWDSTSRGIELVAELARCRGVVLLSRYDGQPRILREAALLGLPTMSTRSSHFAEVVAALGSGVVLSDAADPRVVQAGFRALAEQPGAPLRARSLLDRVAIGQTLLELLRSVAATRAAVRVDHYAAASADRND